MLLFIDTMEILKDGRDGQLIFIVKIHARWALDLA